MSYVARSSEVEFDQETFRQVVGHFASGVTVITSARGGTLYGTTASAVSSLSMDPPMMLMCLNQSSTTHDAVISSGVYAINILADTQQELAFKFGRKGANKFDGVNYRLSDHGGVPLIEGALATIVCSVSEGPRGGTHSVFFGQVLEAKYSIGQPLAYYRGTFGRLEQVKELSTYSQVRQWVLQRRTPLYHDIKIDEMVNDLRSDYGDVFNALVKLAAEGLVLRADSATFTPTPITVELSDGFYSGRATIEMGVIASKIDDFSTVSLQRLTEIAEKMGRIRAAEDPSLEEYLRQHSKFHQVLVSESGSSQLLDSYTRLSIAAVWRDVWMDQDWTKILDHSYVVELVEAIRRGNVEEALAAVSDYTKQAKAFAQYAIERQNGVV